MPRTSTASSNCHPGQASEACASRGPGRAFQRLLWTPAFAGVTIGAGGARRCDGLRVGMTLSRIIGAAALALVARVFVLRRGGVVVEHQAVLAGQRDEAAALGAADQREACLIGQRYAPGGDRKHNRLNYNH